MLRYCIYARPVHFHCLHKMILKNCVYRHNVYTRKYHLGRPVSIVRRYIVKKFFGYVGWYEEFLETKFPQAYKIYQIFAVGIKELYNDVKEYMSISAEIRHGKKFSELSRLELEKYKQVPEDMLKIAPVLILSAVPFANYVVFPIAYYWPQHFLSRQFWSVEQKLSFAEHYHHQTLAYHDCLVKHLQTRKTEIKDPTSRQNLKHILDLLLQKLPRSIEEILECKAAFSNYPFNIEQLSTRHLVHLCGVHAVMLGPRLRYRLWAHGKLLRHIDRAIIREGFDSMNLDDLQRTCFFRGMNPVGLSKLEMISYLKNWIVIADKVDRQSISLLLHCPILLANNNFTIGCLD